MGGAPNALHRRAGVICGVAGGWSARTCALATRAARELVDSRCGDTPGHREEKDGALCTHTHTHVPGLCSGAASGRRGPEGEVEERERQGKEWVMKQETRHHESSTHGARHVACDRRGLLRGSSSQGTLQGLLGCRANTHPCACTRAGGGVVPLLPLFASALPPPSPPSLHSHPARCVELGEGEGGREGTHGRCNDAAHLVDITIRAPQKSAAAHTHKHVYLLTGPLRRVA